MALNSDKKIVFYSDSTLQLREIKWFRLKMAGLIAGIIVFVLSLLLIANHFVYDFIGLQYTQVKALTRENERLKTELAGLSSQVKMLEPVLDKLDREGNRLRLLVDLPAVDEETRAGGTGGAVTEPVGQAISGEAGSALHTTSRLLQQLSSEIKVQEQSYEQIVRKYEYNRAFFSALPALKPMDGYYSTKEFGLRMHPVLGIFKTHTGLDIVADVGTPVSAAGDGVVTMAGQSGGGYGTLIVINHGYGYQSLYAHLSAVMVRDGQRVKRGDIIARSGRTGLVSGPHLHYEVRYKGVCQNPMNYFFDDVPAQEYRKQIASR